MIGLRYVVVLFTALAPMLAFAARLDAPFITGSAVYSTAKLVPAFAEHVGKPVSRQMIDAISAEIQSMYRRDGYVEPIVYAGDAELRSNTPRIHIFDAKIAEVAIRGDAGPYFDSILSLGRVLQANALHRDHTVRFIKRMQELPGLTARAAFERAPSSEPNAYTLVLNVEYRPVATTISAHNRGNDELGRNVFVGRAAFNGLLGLEERISLIGSTTHEFDRYWFGGARFERALGSSNIGIDGYSSRAKYDEDSRYSTQRMRIDFRSTLHDADGLRLQTLFAFGGRDSEGRDSLGEASSETRTRSLDVGFSARHTTDRANSFGALTLAKGLDAAGARAVSKYGSAPELQFFKAGLELAHVQTLAPSWRLRLDGDVQWSADDLPTGERFIFGGSRYGRAFDLASIVGDQGAAASIQIERSIRTRSAALNNGAMFLQADYGYAEDKVWGSDDAASITAGVAAKIFALTLSLELSQSLLAPALNEYRYEYPRVFVSMFASF
jgi:hemolysin activation/secretion protein